MPTAALSSDLLKIVAVDEPWITADMCSFVMADEKTGELLEVQCPAWNCQANAPIVGNRIGNHQRAKEEFRIMFGPCQWVGTQIVHIVPVLESEPGPLPDGTAYLAVLTGKREPDTPMFRLAVAMREHWARAVEDVTRTRQWNPAHLRRARLLSDSLTDEVAAVLADGPAPKPDAPMSGLRYGDEVSDLARFVVLLAVSEKRGEPLEPIQKMITDQTRLLDRLVTNANAGETRLTGTGAYPTRPKGGDGIGEPTSGQ
ncbi:hypothetical protein ACFYTQ_10050 [Nocardia sp. NPDC004068]|uniref:hypothetical protein n=1 Tax=Nocardia sp. NPDC004068 TaxID=3364303 RepID=UPI0036A2E073